MTNELMFDSFLDESRLFFLMYEVNRYATVFVGRGCEFEYCKMLELAMFNMIIFLIGYIDQHDPHLV